MSETRVFTTREEAEAELASHTVSAAALRVIKLADDLGPGFVIEREDWSSTSAATYLNNDGWGMFKVPT